MFVCMQYWWAYILVFRCFFSVYIPKYIRTALDRINNPESERNSCRKCVNEQWLFRCLTSLVPFLIHPAHTSRCTASICRIPQNGFHLLTVQEFMELSAKPMPYALTFTLMQCSRGSGILGHVFCICFCVRVCVFVLVVVLVVCMTSISCGGILCQYFYSGQW